MNIINIFLVLFLFFGGNILSGKNPEDQIPPIPKLICTDFENDFVAPAYLSNGLIGIRPGANPLLAAKTVVSGFIRDFTSEPFESLAPAPYPFQTDIQVEKISMIEHPELVIVKSQTLDMSCGELKTEMLFQPTDKASLKIEVLQFLSRSTPSLVLQEIQIIPSTDLEYEIISIIDTVKAGRNQLGIAAVKPIKNLFNTKANETAKFFTMIAMVSETYHPEPQLQAQRMAGWANMLGFEQLRERNKNVWDELWKSRIKVYGDPDAQRALDVAFFYIHSSAHASNITGIPPFGFSRAAAYFGHVFWDMDQWIFHAILPVSPDAAKAMIEYRYNGLENAKKVARLFGFKGAQYPWEAGTDGREVTPSEAHTGWAEHHVNTCVALAAWEYAIATNDENMLLEMIWPILFEVATWVESRGEWTEKGFEIPNIVGADENQEGTRNNAHMNVMSKMVLKAAIQCAKKVSREYPQSWQEIINKMVIPIDPKYNIVVQFDGAMPEPGGARYAPGMMQLLLYHDPMEYGAIDVDLFKRTYEFEEELRLKLPPHPSNPLSVRAPGFTTPPFAACAAFFGDRKKAADQFRHAWEKYWVKPYGITKEYQHYKEGEYLMNHAALLQAAMYVFTGLRVREGEWNKYPATLPEGWQKIEIDRLWIKGKQVHVVAEHDKKAVLSPIKK
jgi:trehalose/maltose hydrolase-like predicted phosphorylase